MAIKTVTFDFHKAQGLNQALLLKNAKGRRQVRDAIEARNLLVEPWLVEREVAENPEGARFEIVKAMKEKALDVSLEGSVYDYALEAVKDAAEGGKIHDLSLKRLEAAYSALEAAIDAPVTAKPTLVQKDEPKAASA